MEESRIQTLLVWKGSTYIDPSSILNSELVEAEDCIKAVPLLFKGGKKLSTMKKGPLDNCISFLKKEY